MSTGRKVLRILVIGLGVIVGLFGCLLLYLGASRWVWYPRQSKRVEALSEMTLVPSDEDRFAGAALDDAIPLNRLQMVATHNSYHLEPDWIRKRLIGLVEPDEPAKLEYSHPPLWDQLESGIRSFELDVRYHGNRFSITHAPLVDNRGPHPDFELTLDEVVEWSRLRPGHVPIILLLELKSDWMFLDPTLKGWDAKALAMLDETIRSSIPRERHLTPDDIRGGNASPRTAIDTDGWPALGEVRDKIIVVAHTNASTDSAYLESTPLLEGRAMFTSSPHDQLREDALFVLHNNPDPESIDPLVAAGLMVRTRADGDGSAGGSNRTRALSSTAQIISTDHPPGHSNGPEEQLEQVTVDFGAGRTLRQR